MPTGPRGFTQHNGRSVPIYPLGHPLAFGLAHKLFGGAASILLAVIPGFLFLSLALLFRILVPTAPSYLGFMFLGIMPLWYWSSRVYMNLSLMLLFVSLGLVCFALTIRHRSLYWLIAGSSAFALAALVRHPEATFLLLVAIAFIIAVIRQQTPFQWNHTLRVVALYAIPQLLLFLLPWPY
jgi:4-amino-4-deoxy-L-arabinose transferase-like glycosyltransferase